MSNLNKLLMMFVKDGYSASGKISKKTAMAMMRFVGADKKLQSHINSSDWKSVLNHDASGWISVDDEMPADGSTVSLLFRETEWGYTSYGYGFYAVFLDDIEITYNPLRNTVLDYKLTHWKSIGLPESK